MPFDDGARTRILHYSTGFQHPELVDTEGRRLRLEPEREGRFRCELDLAGELSFFMRDVRSGEEDRPPGGGTYRLERDRRESWLESGAILDVDPRRLEGVLVDAHTHPYRREGSDRFTFDPSALLELPRHGVRAALTMVRAPLGEQRIPLKIRYQACTEDTCLAPVTLDLEAVVTVAAAGTKPRPAHPELFATKGGSR